LPEVRLGVQESNPGLGGLLARGLAKGAPAPTLLLAHRLAANCCKHAPLRKWLLACTPALFDLLADADGAGSKQSRAALATVLLNYGAAIASGEAAGAEEERMRALSMLCEARPCSRELVAEGGSTAWTLSSIRIARLCMPMRTG
jgi:PUL domain